MTMLNRFAVWRAGAKSVVLQGNPDRQLDAIDGLIVGGGDDIGADLYGGQVKLSVRTDPERDRLEMKALDAVEKRGKPVLGICRGSQMINIHRGGTLFRDVYEKFISVPRGRSVLAVRTVWLEAESLLQDLFDCEATRVNVMHHQSVDRLGDGMTVNARDRYGIVQGTELTDASSGRFVCGVQWHPEFLPYSRKQFSLFRSLINAARAS